MQTFRTFLTIALLVSMASHVYGQNYDPAYEYGDYTNSAYMQGTRVAHWSVYVPIAVFAAAGIFFGIADKKHGGSSGSKEGGLGPLEKYSSSSSSGRYSGSSSHSKHYTGHSH